MIFAGIIILFSPVFLIKSKIIPDKSIGKQLLKNQYGAIVFYYEETGIF